VLEELGPDPMIPNNTILLRKNGGRATVAGGSVEFRMNYNNDFEITSGATYQKSRYKEKVFWSAELNGSNEFFKSPDLYGFYLIDFYFFNPFKISINGVFTGSMFVPHVAGAPGVEFDELKETKSMLETNIKLAYKFGQIFFSTGFELFGGIQNLFDQYQNDFDTGPYRDSNYIYGPAKPRTYFIGIKIGN
jgi:outer membrane receptor for ferrienterochelin and colicins